MSLWQDLRYAARQLWKRPGFSLAAIVTLALGIGATTAVFSFVYGVLLKPLPYAAPGQLVVLWEQVKYLAADHPYVEANFRHAEYWKRRATDFADIALLREGTAGVAVKGSHPGIVGVVLGYPNLLPVLGVQPALGRNFTAEEGVDGHNKVVILTYDLWQRVYGGDPEVLGKTLLLNGAPLQIVGVLPASFHFPKGNALLPPSPERGTWPGIGVFVPLVIDQPNEGLDGDFNFVALARLKPGASVTHATAQLDVIDRSIMQDYAREAHVPVSLDTLRSYVQPLQETVVGPVKRMLWMLLASVGAVLLIACVNLASLQMARTKVREKEFAVRVALGATSMRLLVASSFEGALLAVLGGVAGLFVAAMSVRLFAAHAPLDLPRLDEVTLNPGVLCFAAGVTALTAVAFGLLPAWRALRAEPQTTLQGSSGRGSVSPLARRAQFGLITAQVAIATVLLIVMGLLSRSLFGLLREQRGFATDHVVSAEVDVDGQRYNEDPKRAAFDEEVLRSLRAIPGVESAGLVSAMPLSGETWLDDVKRPDHPSPEPHIANYRWISPDYLATLRIGLRRGRQFTEADRNAKVALISQRTAEQIWPDEDPLGRQFRREDTTYTVVGVVADTRSNSLKQAPGLLVYLPFWDNPPYPTFFMMRTAMDPVSAGDTIRRKIWSVNPEANLAHVLSMDAQVNESLGPERAQTFVLTSFGLAALLLAAAGIYGTLSTPSRPGAGRLGFASPSGSAKAR